jgi:transposase
MIADRIEALLADEGDDAIRQELAKAGIEAIIPAKHNQKQPAPRDDEKCKWRSLIECLFNKLKNWRRVATRYDKSKVSYLGFVAIAAVKLWLRFVHEAQKQKTRPSTGRACRLAASIKARRGAGAYFVPSALNCFR